MLSVWLFATKNCSTGASRHLIEWQGSDLDVYLGGGGHPIMAYSSKSPPKRPGPHFVSPQVYVRPGISLVEVFKG